MVRVEWTLNGAPHHADFLFALHAELFCQLVRAVTGTKLVKVAPCST